MCYHVCVIMHVKDPCLSVVRVGHCVPLAGFCLSLYSLHVLNMDVNMTQTIKSYFQGNIEREIPLQLNVRPVTLFHSPLTTCSFIHLSFKSKEEKCDNNYRQKTCISCGMDLNGYLNISFLLSTVSVDYQHFGKM